MCEENKNTHIFTYLQLHIYIYIHTYIPTHLPTYLPTGLRTYLPTYLRTYVPTYLRTYVPSDLPTYLRTYVHTPIHVYIHINMGQPKRPQAPLHRGGTGRGQTRPDGESNNAKQDNYPLDRQGGIPWGGVGRGGVGRAASCMVTRSAAPPLPPPPWSMVQDAPPSCGMECGFPLPPVGWLWGFWV